MGEKLVKLYNTLSTIETKGNNTKTMADCLRYLERMIEEVNKPVEPSNENVETEVE